MSKVKHFKLREDLSVEICGIKLFRIEATKDIEQHNVKCGELGGYIEKRIICPVMLGCMAVQKCTAMQGLPARLSRNPQTVKI